MSMSDEKIFEIANNLREEKEFSVSTLLEKLVEENIKLNFDEIYNFNSFWNSREYLVPKIICEFLESFVKDKQNLKVLDPWCHFGELLNSVSSSTVKSIGINLYNKDLIIASKMLSSNKNLQLIKGDPHKELEYINEKFSLILSCFPFSSIKKSQKIGGNEIFDSEFNLLMLKASNLLSQDGKGFFVVPPSFFNNATEKSVRKSLKKFDLFIDAIFYLPPGTFKNTSIASYLIVTSRVKFGELFIAELGNKENINTILENWKYRKKGKVFSLGYLTKTDHFLSFEKIEKELEIERLVSKSNLTPFQIQSFASEIKISNKNLDNGFEEKPNTIYLPLIGLSNTVSRLDEITLKPQNYVQIVIDPKKASADFIANWFNTDLGILVRESLMNGTTIQRISKSSIMNAIVYLPTYETQIHIVDLHSKITNLRAELSSIEGHLWKNPASYRNIKLRLRELNRNTGLEEWIEKLPFPLASILWKYYATKDVRNKKDFLLYFFEALAQFEVVLMLSAFNNDKELLSNEINLDIEKISRSTFGSWVIFGEQLAKLIRTHMSSNHKDRCLRMFRTKKKELIEVICSKKVYQVLKITKDYRNDWKGHGGVEGVRESKSRLKLLEAELVKIREVFGDVFEDTQLIKPGQGHFENGLFHSRCSLLMGTRSSFKDVAIKTTSGLDINKLYFVEDSSHDPLELLPFIRLMPSPSTEENACYFYNRIDKNGVRMVSYYFDRDSEITIPEDNISNIIESLIRN